MASIYFHGDSDGVCAAVLVERAVGGSKLFPVLKPSDLAKEVKSGNPAFILDLSPTQITVDSLASQGPVLVIDHHVARPLANAFQVNPRLVGLPPYPASYVAYAIFGGPAWIALTGVTNDWGLKMTPKLVSIVKRQNPGFISGKTQEEVYIKDKVGKLGRSIDALIALRGKAGAKRAVKLMATSPSQALSALRPAFDRIEKEIAVVLTKPERMGHLLFLGIQSRHSIKSQVIQRLKLNSSYAGKTLLVSQRAGKIVQFSLRSSKIDLTKLIEKALRGLEGEGGGHPLASGGWVAASDFEKFLSRCAAEV